jgi:hypothetical protein
MPSTGRATPDPVLDARLRGYATGVRNTLDTLERAGCLTTAHARRFVDRLRRQMPDPSTDMVRCPHREALERMHRNLYPEQYEPGTDTYQWHAGTIEDVAGILNDALGHDSEGRPRV